MPNSCTLFGYVRKAGDVMTGDLDLGLHSLVLNDGSHGGRIRGDPAVANRIELRNIADGADGDLAANLVDGIDVSEIKQAKVMTGKYTGDGTTPRDINIGVNLAAKSYAVVIVKDMQDHRAWVNNFVPNEAYSIAFDTTSFSALKISARTSTGFRVTSDDDVNLSPREYRYVVFWQED
jgi:hypothetical protein